MPFDVDPGEFSADRRRVDGTRSVWAASGGGRALTRWDLRANVWTVSSEIPAASWRDAVAADTDLLTIRAVELTEFTVPDPDVLLDLLVVDGGGEPDDEEWPFDVDKWETEDEDFRYPEGQLRRYASVNGVRVQFLEADGHPVAVLTDQDELVGGTEIAGWVRNQGGDPLSMALHQVRPGVAAAIQRDDSNQRVLGFRHEIGSTGQAVLLSDWLEVAADLGTGGGAAAVALQPFDPEGTVSGEQLVAWDEALAEARYGWDYTYRVWFDVPETIKDELRRILVTDSRYVRVRDALADPLRNEWLREELSSGLTESLW